MFQRERTLSIFGKVRNLILLIKCVRVRARGILFLYDIIPKKTKNKKTPHYTTGYNTSTRCCNALSYNTLQCNLSTLSHLGSLFWFIGKIMTHFLTTMWRGRVARTGKASGTHSFRNAFRPRSHTMSVARETSGKTQRDAPLKKEAAPVCAHTMVPLSSLRRGPQAVCIQYWINVLVLKLTAGL